MYVAPVFEFILGCFGLWTAHSYWTDFGGERFWRVLSVIMFFISCGAFGAAAWMVCKNAGVV